MIFSTYTFILLFFPFVFSVYSLFLKYNSIKTAKWWLVASSLYFYYYGTGTFFWFFAGSIIFNYTVGTRLAKSFENGNRIKRKCLLCAGLLENILLLGYFKYTDFLITNINVISGASIQLKNIILPIGISFFTFQLIAYLLDSYRGETKEYTLLSYLLFITFFPQLIVGPIVHHKDVVPQYNDNSTFKLSHKNVIAGLFLFSMGCTKKIMIADYLTTNAQFAFDHAQSLNMVEAWCASLSYTFSYYFDLSAYADMAIGLGLLFNIELPVNFNSPYKARNFADYWRRWHMTLSRFLNDYIFRSVYKKGGGSKNFYWAVFVTFLVSGFWHGAGWTFVVWGVVNGAFVIFAHMMERNSKSLPNIVARMLTFLGIVLTRVLFVSGTFKDAIFVLRTMFDLTKFNFQNTFYIDREQPLYILMAFVLSTFFANSNQIKDRVIRSIEVPRQSVSNYKYAFATAVLFVIAFLNMEKVGDFLYFQF